jgi:putative Mg2+ transporter-C (MgtC) family protein
VARATGVPGNIFLGMPGAPTGNKVVVSREVFDLTVAVPSSNIEGWRQLGELGLALVLSALIGFERGFRQKSAGLRTHALVGLGAALFMLVSKCGFSDIITTGRAVLDPSRVAAEDVNAVTV